MIFPESRQISITLLRKVQNNKYGVFKVPLLVRFTLIDNQSLKGGARDPTLIPKKVVERVKHLDSKGSIPTGVDNVVKKPLMATISDVVASVEVEASTQESHREAYPYFQTPEVWGRWLKPSF